MSTNCLFGFLPFGPQAAESRVCSGKKRDEKRPGRGVFHDPALNLLKTFPRKKCRKALRQRGFAARCPAARGRELLKKGDGAGGRACTVLLRLFCGWFCAGSV